MALDSDDGGSGVVRQPPMDEKLQKRLDKALYAGGNVEAQKLRNFLNGTWLGEPLHVVLTDLPIGAWTAAMFFDFLDLIVDRHEFAFAADASIGVGLAGAAGAAATGLTDWSDVDPPARRLGLIHGLMNLGGTALFAISLLLRRKQYRKSGRAASVLGFAVMSYAAHLGGKLVYDHRVGVDRTNGLVLPDKFVPVLPESQLADNKPTQVTVDGVPILLVRRAGRLFALADTCSHFGAPLSDGKLVDNCIECPYHASRFDLMDGHVVNGPAVHPQPCLEVRVLAGQIEVRKSPLGAY
ncbi:MAG TPA: Rieske 2Fe-2S domain-containing protein [Terriglobales bacterium]|nr:Rieske 2Fe-2S domain-containing protein [Terriglobales bacterium]